MHRGNKDLQIMLSSSLGVLISMNHLASVFSRASSKGVSKMVDDGLGNSLGENPSLFSNLAVRLS